MVFISQYFDELKNEDGADMVGVLNAMDDDGLVADDCIVLLCCKFSNLRITLASSR